MRRLILLLAGITLPLLSFGQEMLSGDHDIQNDNLVAGVTLSSEEMPSGQTFTSAPKGWFNSQGSTYTIKPAVDIPIIAAGTIWSAYAFGKIYAKDKIPAEVVSTLDRDNIPAIDRWAAGKSNHEMDKNSNYLFYGSIPLPALLFIDRKMRADAGRIAILYWESFAITGLFYTGSAYFIDRYRPETYATQLSVESRTSGNNKNAFLAGHPALVATSTFFMAKVYNDYHPDNNWKWAFWGGAAAATGTMIYMRHVAGKHFPTDLLAGTALGVASGILVPHFHKNRDMNKQVWNIGPSFNPYGSGGAGLAFSYRF